jgi:hypothetical protein
MLHQFQRGTEIGTIVQETKLAEALLFFWKRPQGDILREE